jgi:3-phenylpropionate/cinnamic acid dioxygenase small subunit
MVRREERVAARETQTALDRMLLHHEVEQFFTYEVSLLDERRWEEWLDLLADDIRYYMPFVRNVKYGEHAERELTREQEDINWFDEGKDTLTKRLQQIMTGIHWAEEPLSRVVHLVTNVQVADVKSAGGEVHTKCNFLVYRNRLEMNTDILAGRRKDVLRKAEGQWKLARREIILAQNVLTAKNLTLLF